MTETTLCEDCPCKKQCKAQGCHREEIEYEEALRLEREEWERREYERMWHEENGY